MIWGNKKRVYADYASTTLLNREVARHMRYAERTYIANPSSIYKEGVDAHVFLEHERERVARLLSVRSHEIYFTSGGTEANATIISGVINSRIKKGIVPRDIHVITSIIKHSSVLETIRTFEKQGIRVTYIIPHTDGIVRVEDVTKAVRPETVLISIMYVNNEIGTIQPISKIGGIVRKMRAETMSEYPVLHSDASQAPLWLDCSLEGLRIDALTLDAHKMEGPRGIGAMVVKSHVLWEPLMVGGGQEFGKRPTTESLSLIAGFTEALAHAVHDRERRVEKVRKVRDTLVSLTKNIPDIVINGSLVYRLPNNLNVSLLTLSDAELAILIFDKHGVACSTKSSCLKGEEESYTVKSLGGDPRCARTTLRFSFGPHSTMSDIRRIATVLARLSEQKNK